MIVRFWAWSLLNILLLRSGQEIWLYRLADKRHMGFSRVDRNRLADRKKNNLVPRFSLLLVSISLRSVGTGRNEPWERGWKKNAGLLLWLRRYWPPRIETYDYTNHSWFINCPRGDTREWKTSNTENNFFSFFPVWADIFTRPKFPIWPLQKIPEHTITLFVYHLNILHKHCFQFLLGVKWP